MSTTKDYKDYVLNQLGIMDGITCKSMMGEYLLYYKDVLFGGIYDNRVLVKIVSSNDLYNLSKKIPYSGAKPMYLIDNLDNKELLKKIILDTCKSLPLKK